MQFFNFDGKVIKVIYNKQANHDKKVIAVNDLLR